MIDLTGGFGVDTYFLSENFQKAIYCERNEELAAIVRHNFDLLKPGKFGIVEGDSLAYFSKSDQVFDLTYVDPARRGEHNQKLYKLADCEPDIVGYWSLLQSKSNAILIKASPMLDIKQALAEIPEIKKLWVISVKNEVKEVLLLWEKGKEAGERIIHAVDLQSGGPKGFSFTYEEEESSESIFGEVGKFLIEPYASVSTTMGPVSAKLGAAYAWEQDSLGGDDNLYLYTDWGLGVPNTPISIAAHLGYTDGALSPKLLTGVSTSGGSGRAGPDQR